MNKDEMKVFLQLKGWATYYNENYWVNPKMVADPKSQDYTNYGMSLEDAYIWETKNIGPVKNRFGIPGIDIIAKLSEKQ